MCPPGDIRLKLEPSSTAWHAAAASRRQRRLLRGNVEICVGETSRLEATVPAEEGK
jgi:hypothetical protein